MTEATQETVGPGVDAGAADNVEVDKPLVIRSSVCEGYTPTCFTARIPANLIVLGLDVVTVDGVDDFVLFYAGNAGEIERTHEVTFNYAPVGDYVPENSGQHLALKVFNGEHVAVFSVTTPPVDLRTGQPDPATQEPTVPPVGPTPGEEERAHPETDEVSS